MDPVKPQAIELPMPWVLSQYIPRNRLRVVVARCNARIEAVRLMEAIATTDAALRPCLAVHHVDHVQLISGRPELQVPA